MVNLDVFMPAALQYIRDRGGRIEISQLHRVYGIPLTDLMLMRQVITQHTVMRKDIRGKVRPFPVTYVAVKGWKPQASSPPSTDTQ